MPPSSGIEVSDRWVAAISESHTVKTVVDVHRLDIDIPITQLGVTEGAITMNAGDSTRRSADLTVIDQDGTLSPAEAEDILSPLTAEIRIWSGIVYTDGTEELVSCGYYAVDEYEMVRDGGRRTYKLTCFDRSKRCVSQFGRPFSTVPNAPLEDVIADMIHFKAPTIPRRLPVTGLFVPALVFPGNSNAWAEAEKLANWSGYTLEIDRQLGEIVMNPTVTDVGKDPVWEFVDDERAVAWEVESSFSRADAPNHVIVRGQGSSADDVFGEAWDNDPTSPTYVGRIGYNTREYSDERVITDEQATRAAQRILGRDLGKAKVHPLKALPNPALELDQTVKLRQLDYGLDTFALVEKVELPLTSGNDKHMSVTLRRGVQTDSQLLALILSQA